MLSTNIHNVLSVTLSPPEILTGRLPRGVHTRDIDVTFDVDGKTETMNITLFGHDVTDGGPIPLNAPEVEALLAGARPPTTTDEALQDESMALRAERASLVSDYEAACDELATARAELDAARGSLATTMNGLATANAEIRRLNATLEMESSGRGMS